MRPITREDAIALGAAFLIAYGSYSITKRIMTNPYERVWVDASRRPPDNTWYWCSTVTEALRILSWRKTKKLSLTYKMNDLTTQPIVDAIIERGDGPGDLEIHTWIRQDAATIAQQLVHNGWPVSMVPYMQS